MLTPHTWIQNTDLWCSVDENLYYRENANTKNNAWWLDAADIYHSAQGMLTWQTCPEMALHWAKQKYAAVRPKPNVLSVKTWIFRDFGTVACTRSSSKRATCIRALTCVDVNIESFIFEWVGSRLSKYLSCCGGSWKAAATRFVAVPYRNQLENQNLSGITLVALHFQQTWSCILTTRMQQRVIANFYAPSLRHS